jgi:uncharacterized Fe-S center protein
MKKKPKPAKVYFVDLRAGMQRSVMDKLREAMRKANLLRVTAEGDLVAVKLHFGEKDSTAYLRTPYVKAVIDLLIGNGRMPFLTDTNTLYVGTRSDSVRHITTAVENGFSFASTGVPVIIADGLKGGQYESVKIDGKHFSEVKVAADIARADSMVVLTHVKGHELTGIGGALKNLGMGGGSRAGKLEMHSDVRPRISTEKCTGCGKCLQWCQVKAISLKGKKAVIDTGICVGCAECILVCPQKAPRIEWNWSGSLVQEKMVEYAAGVARTKKRGVGCVNFIMDFSPQCDCYPFSDTPVIPNVGILISRDPVAIDRASADLVNRQQALKGSALGKKHAARGDKIRMLHPDVDWKIQIKHGETMGLGSGRYELVKVT